LPPGDKRIPITHPDQLKIRGDGLRLGWLLRKLGRVHADGRRIGGKMRITRIEAIPVAVPIHHDGPPTGFGGVIWSALTHVLVRVETEDGRIGWGEAFGYNIAPATVAAVEQTLAPLALGRDATDIAALIEDLARHLHLFGRAGPAQYALSGLDIALWDLAGKRAGLPVAALLGGGGRPRVPAYTSLLRLNAAEHVRKACAKARERGFGAVKLHEITIETVAAAREVLGDAIALMLDVNCAWRPAEALAMAQRLLPYDLRWLEEPVWPPEDLAGLTRLRSALPGMKLAAGENIGNVWQFRPLAESPALDFLQPSVTKMGGISGFLKVALQAELHGKELAPHSPYFGPGLLASLQMAALFPAIEMIECFGVTLEAPFFGPVGLPEADGAITIPTGPGIGADPDPEVIRRYRVT